MGKGQWNTNNLCPTFLDMNLKGHNFVYYNRGWFDWHIVHCLIPNYCWILFITIGDGLIYSLLSYPQLIFNYVHNIDVIIRRIISTFYIFSYKSPFLKLLVYTYLYKRNTFCFQNNDYFKWWKTSGQTSFSSAELISNKNIVFWENFFKRLTNPAGC